jgi:hypothetical protein
MFHISRTYDYGLGFFEFDLVAKLTSLVSAGLVFGHWELGVNK